MNTNFYTNVIAITGIIGSGKSTVSDLLEKKGAVVIRADALSAQALDPSYSNYPYVEKKISDMLNKSGKANDVSRIFPSGSVNRQLLGEIIFSDAELTRRLGEIIHPEVRRLFHEKISQIPTDKIIVYDVPLLFETGMHKLMKKNIVVYAPERIAINRAVTRMAISEDQVKKRLNHQISSEQKKDMADYVLDNSGNLDQLIIEVEKLWSYLQEIT